MQSLDYKLKTSNTSYVTARHDVQHLPSRSRSPSASGTRTAPTRWPWPRPTPPAASSASGLRQRPALRRHQLLRPHRGRARAQGPRVQPQQGHGGYPGITSGAQSGRMHTPPLPTWPDGTATLMWAVARTRLGFSPICFLEQSEPFNLPYTYVRKLILVGL